MRCRLAIFSITKREATIALAVALIATLVGGAFSRQQDGDLAVARAQAATARTLAQAADNRAGLLAERADTAAAHAALAEHRADSLAHLPARTHYLTVRASAPDTCAALVAAADSALAVTDSVASQLRSANLSLHTALDSTSVALATVRASQVNLGAATSTLERASKPSRLRALIPRPTVGVSAGVDVYGHPHVIAGVGLGWSL